MRGNATGLLRTAHHFQASSSFNAALSQVISPCLHAFNKLHVAASRCMTATMRSPIVMIHQGRKPLGLYYDLEGCAPLPSLTDHIAVHPRPVLVRRVTLQCKLCLCISGVHRQHSRASARHQGGADGCHKAWQPAESAGAVVALGSIFLLLCRVLDVRAHFAYTS